MKSQFPAKIKKDEKGRYYIDFNHKNNVKFFLSEQKEEKEIVVTIENLKQKRSNAQNNSIHLFCSKWAKEMNDAGITRKVVFETLAKKGVEMEWTMEAVKDIWRSIQKDKVGKWKTRKLLKDEVDKVYDPFNQIMGEITKIHIPFPSIEDVILNY